MFDLNLPHLTDAGARDLGAAATAKLVRIVESATARRLVTGSLALGFCVLSFYTLRELRSGAAVRHEVVHGGGHQAAPEAAAPAAAAAAAAATPLSA